LKPKRKKKSVKRRKDSSFAEGDGGDRTGTPITNMEARRPTTQDDLRKRPRVENGKEKEKEKKKKTVIT
jgi:hypothetical protein